VDWVDLKDLQTVKLAPADEELVQAIWDIH